MSHSEHLELLTFGSVALVVPRSGGNGKSAGSAAVTCVVADLSAEQIEKGPLPQICLDGWVVWVQN